MRIPLVCAFFVLSMERYNVIEEKRPREIVLLRGHGCVYKKCTFCDYHLDSSKDDLGNFTLNKSVLDRVSGKYHEIEIINSGSVFELDGKTIDYIKHVCRLKYIKTIHFEAHFLFDKLIPKLREDFNEFELKMKLGLETFDYDFREKVLLKGIPQKEPEIISKNFDEANLLVGVEGQNLAMIDSDIKMGLKFFERICVNVFNENTTKIKPDNQLIAAFMKYIYPKYKDNLRVDILVNNTDFGVGE